VIAPLRNRQFFSVEEINEAMRPLLEELNTREMRHIGRSRKELFEEIERPALKELPRYAFEVSERKAQKVGQSYHVSWKGHYYSVPYTLVGKTVEIRATGRTVEVYHEASRVASHIRDDTPGTYSTDESHMPESHRAVKKKVSREGVLRQAQRIGPSVVELIEKLYQSRRHPEQAQRAALGILAFRRKHKEQEIEAACQVAIEYDLISYKHVKNLLSVGMFKEEDKQQKAVSEHKNLRGSGYYN
jgi:flagellar biosynthesis GTPase FlhF